MVFCSYLLLFFQSPKKETQTKLKFENCLLIDGFYINSPGGIRLLLLLIKQFKQKGIPALFVLDERIKLKINTENSECVKIIFKKTTFINRYLFYFKNVIRAKKFNKILCFGNIPPLIECPVPVYTFFQNVLLLSTSKSFFSLKSRTVFYLKRLFIRYFSDNSDYWIVQTINVKEELCEKIKIQPQNCLIIPFYDIEKAITSEDQKVKNSFIYVSTALPHKNHILLLKAWEELYKEGYNFILHLTVPLCDSAIIKEINRLIETGINIQNHQYIEKKDMDKLYSQSEYVVYPSLNESFGLGLIEGAIFGCKIIAADLPYVHAVVDPVSVFNPYDYLSIKNSVLESIKSDKNISILKITNEIDKLTQILKP